ncbi:MAG TPA: alcohol dehydrogenase catalytic domain-containing protein [bacterium]|nr:alcohol dehydrogenase catalytic domain-containing protein [bacterium]
MKALRCTDTGLMLEDQCPEPRPSAGEVLIRPRMAGICRTDLELTKGYMGFHGILGHEFVGEVAEAGAGWEAGVRVVGEINVGCGTCPYCRKELARHCPHRTTLGIYNRDGCLAEYMTLPAANLFRAPDGIPDEILVFTEPLAAVLEIFEQIQVRPVDRICVLGDGKLGLLAALVLAFRHEGESLLVGRHPGKLGLVEDFLPTLREQELDAVHHKQWDIVIEATGATQGLRQALRLVRPRGTIVLKSTMAGAEAVDLTPAVIDEVTVVGSRCGRFAPALAWLSRGVLPLDRLIEAVYPLEKAQEAWAHAVRPGAKKVLILIHPR